MAQVKSTHVDGANTVAVMFSTHCISAVISSEQTNS